MKKEIFYSAIFTFFIVLAFIFILQPGRVSELPIGNLSLYALACATVSTTAVCLAILASWKWLKLSRKRYGYWGRLSIGIITVPQLIVGICILNAITFDATPYQLMDNALQMSQNVLAITIAVFVFDYIVYRTRRNKEKRQRINQHVTLFKKEIENTATEQLISITPSIIVETSKILYASYDGYYTKIVYLDNNNKIKTRDIPIEIEKYIESVRHIIPTLIQCHKKYAINTIHMISIKMNWFGILRIHLKHTDFRVPANIIYSPKPL
ncbi:MAG: hypothetical protein Q4C30_07435 [Bacteroidia bacterium]|nr:hypothetical protein [Bacteroidia bacterium]